MIEAIGTVFVPTKDQEKALAFWVGKLDFEKRVDASYGGGRWIEVAPKGSPIAFALVPSGEGTTTTTETVRCALSTHDIAATHASLQERGVDIDRVVGSSGTERPGLVSTDVSVRDPAPPQVVFRDPEGNRFLLVEVPRAAK